MTPVWNSTDGLSLPLSGALWRFGCVQQDPFLKRAKGGGVPRVRSLQSSHRQIGAELSSHFLTQNKESKASPQSI